MTGGSEWSYGSEPYNKISLVTKISRVCTAETITCLKAFGPAFVDLILRTLSHIVAVLNQAAMNGCHRIATE